MCAVLRSSAPLLPRPLFVAEADFRASKVFTRVKKGMLALYGTDLQVLDVEAADAAGGMADVSAHVLRWVNYTDVSSGHVLEAAVMLVL
jgi:hypothetical protein